MEHGADERALATLLAEMRGEFPRFRIVDKRGSKLSKLIDVVLRVLTLGGQAKYLTHYHTVIGDTLYVPSGWDESTPVRKMITLRHERVHLRQRRRYSMPGMALLYLLPLLPIGLALGRARLEWEAYRETLRATFELEGAAALLDPALREYIVAQFTGPAYGWMWPFRGQVERWYDEALAEIGSETDASGERPADLT
jgi:hypothetical protein